MVLYGSGVFFVSVLWVLFCGFRVDFWGIDRGVEEFGFFGIFGFVWGILNFFVFREYKVVGGEGRVGRF